MDPGLIGARAFCPRARRQARRLRDGASRSVTSPRKARFPNPLIHHPLRNLHRRRDHPLRHLHVDRVRPPVLRMVEPPVRPQPRNILPPNIKDIACLPKRPLPRGTNRVRRNPMLRHHPLRQPLQFLRRSLQAPFRTPCHEIRPQVDPNMRPLRKPRFLRRKWSNPVCPSSCPVLAVKTTPRRGRFPAKCRSKASQTAMPPPRSAVQVHQALLGVITTTGASEGSRPGIRATTLLALAGSSATSTTTRAASPRDAASSSQSPSSLATCNTGGPKDRRNGPHSATQAPAPPHPSPRWPPRPGNAPPPGQPQTPRSHPPAPRFRSSPHKSHRRHPTTAQEPPPHQQAPSCPRRTAAPPPPDAHPPPPHNPPGTQRSNRNVCNSGSAPASRTSPASHSDVAASPAVPVR